MILINGIEIEPTRFPDGTTQNWKLPTDIVFSPFQKVEWYYESDSEIFQLFSLRTLLRNTDWHLRMLYLPYARQDKEVTNESTFNLAAFGFLINQLRCNQVASFDVHNEERAKALISNFVNISADKILQHLTITEPFETLVFPDKGAYHRYRCDWLGPKEHKRMVFLKDRCPITGEINSFSVWSDNGTKAPQIFSPNEKVLIIDDICDGGATFIPIIHHLKIRERTLEIHLYVSHGIFSKGEKIFEDLGVTIHTTNSLLKNRERGIKIL